MNKIFKTLAASVLGLALAAGVGVGVSAGSKASEVKAVDTKTLTFSLTSNPGGWPTTSNAGNYDYTLDGTNYTFALGTNVYWNSGGYLMLKYTTSLGLPAITNYKLTKVVAKNSSGCSTSTKVGVSSSASSASYISGGAIQTWSTTSSTYTYNLSGTSDNTVYYLYVTNKNAQITQLDLTYEGQAEDVDLTDIGLPSTASVQVGSTTTLTPIKTPTNANKNDTLSWESLDPSVATVNASNGVVSGVSVGTATIRVNATDIGKSAICTVTVNPVPPVPVTHTIAQCYTVATGTSVKFNGVYMGAYGNNPYQGIFFGDGESGIMIYQVSSVPSTWEVGKTVVAVSGKTAFYNGLVQITGASFELTSATVATPVVYTFLGNETTNTILSRKSSISGTVTAVTGQTSGAFVTGTDGKVTIDLGNGSTALVFIKKGVFSSEELNTFTEAYKVGNYVVSTGFVGYYKSGQSKDSAYDPASWQIVVPSVVSVGKYGAVEFAQDFLADTDTICSSGSNDNLSALQAMWTDEAAKYTALTSEERQKLVDSSATDTDIVGAIARYKYICGKYNTSEHKVLEEFIEGATIVYNSFFVQLSNNNNNAMITTIVITSIASITLLGVTLFIKKRKATH